MTGLQGDRVDADPADRRHGIAPRFRPGAVAAGDGPWKPYRRQRTHGRARRAGAMPLRGRRHRLSWQLRKIRRRGRHTDGTQGGRQLTWLLH